MHQKIYPRHLPNEPAGPERACGWHPPSPVHPHSSAQYSTVQHSTAQYNTVQYMTCAPSQLCTGSRPSPLLTVQHCWDSRPSEFIPLQSQLDIAIGHTDIAIGHTVQYSTVQYSTVQYSTVQYSTVQYSTVQYSTVQYSTVQYSTVQYSTVQYSTVQYSTVQYSTVHWTHKLKEFFLKNINCRSQGIYCLTFEAQISWERVWSTHTKYTKLIDSKES